MTISIGVDETIFRFTKSERVFIYVASCSLDSLHDYSSEDKSFKKRRCEDKPLRLNLDGIAGFLFGAFSYGNILRFGKKDPLFFEEQKKILPKRVLETNSSLILGILNLIRSAGFYNIGEKIDVVFDGHDMYKIQESLESCLEKDGYRLDDVNIKFIPKGDEIVSLVNTSDAIAYVLRALLDRERLKLMRNRGEEGVKLELNEGSNLTNIKDLIPYHMSSENWERRSLERRVA